MVARDIVLAEATGAPVHIAHLSTAGGVRHGPRGQGARRPGHGRSHAPPSAAHRRGYPGRPTRDFKMNPPLRSRADVAALVEGSPDGRHRRRSHRPRPPHGGGESPRPFVEAPFGIVGLETAVSLILDRLRPARRHRPRDGSSSSSRPHPARRARPGRTRAASPSGADADLTASRPRTVPVTVDRERVRVQGPQHALRRLDSSAARPVMTIVGGRVVYPFPSHEEPDEKTLDTRGEGRRPRLPGPDPARHGP
ncbi:MAG: hypothetical protein MZU95_01880 [Desulfomicrobium escambiense]|nr:hypothetical protein [Desulfomicrobium escambiense]